MSWQTVVLVLGLVALGVAFVAVLAFAPSDTKTKKGQD